MGLHTAVVTTLCLILLVLVYSQIKLTAADNSRDYLFIKPRNFVKQRAEKNKTRFTVEEKWMILQIHNSYRSVVEPPAADMRELVWDNDLEDYAWNHTQACTGAHSAGTMVKKWRPDAPSSWKTWTAMGENLYYSYAPWFSVEEALWMFWEEGLDYDIATHNCTSKYTCGHYRVLVLAAASRIGCALNTCNNFSASSYPTPAVFFSCSYDGKYLIYYRPYTVGERGSHCTYDLQGSEFEYSRYGLCISGVMKYYNTGFDGNTSIVGLPSNYLTSTTTSTISSTFAPDTTTISMEYPTTTTEAYTTAETYITTRGERITEKSTQEEVITSTHPPTSIKQTLKTRTVSHAAGLCVWVSHLILLLLVYVVASLQ